jgi:hypothetical protein
MPIGHRTGGVAPRSCASRTGHRSQQRRSHRRQTRSRSARSPNQPDLVALIEPVKLDDYDQVVDLLGPDYHVVYQAHRAADGTGSAIASRWPIVDIRACARLFDEPAAGVWASDHFGVVADLAVPAVAAAERS